MHQTFYIDIDEEITSIVDRLKKSKTNEVVIVVPRRALLIQSIVNLKLLKKEADSQGKQVMIVTQDKLGKSLVEKVGMLVQEKIDESEDEVLMPSNEKKEDFSFKISPSEGKNNEKMDKIGSSEYFDEPGDIKKEPKIKSSILNVPQQQEKIINKELVSNFSESIKEKRKSPSMDIVKNVEMKQQNDLNFEKQPEKIKIDYPQSDSMNKIFQDSNESGNFNSQNKLENFFHNNEERRIVEKNEEIYKDANISGKFWKIFLAFILISILAIFLIAAYLFLPKVGIKISTKSGSETINGEMKGIPSATEVNVDENIIPVRTISSEEEFSQSYETRGAKSSSSQKARGIITIYNEFGTEPQSLVATTRFQTEDGKIFRLVKGVTVPGTSKVGEEVKPGAIEAEVVADEAGKEYNIEPTKFTIPGFKDSPNGKFNKFYAKSAKAMTGGGISSDAIKTVTKADMEEAKTKSLSEFTSLSLEKMKSLAAPGEVVLEDAVNIGEPVYSFSNSEGQVADNLKINLKVKVSTIVFKESDLKEIVAKKIASKISKETDLIDKDNLKFLFGKSDADFSKEELLIRFDATGKIGSEIDMNNFKTEILGKNEDELKAYLKNYPEIENVEITYWPSFISGKIPSYEKRVEILLDNVK